MPSKESKPMPALFVGHGNPMNVVARNAWTEGWQALGQALPRPRAILAVSAHWYVSGTMLTAMPHPRTIHDFGGFPDALYRVTYPAPGDPALAARVKELLASVPAGLDDQWGLDHGTWSVLHHVYPQADIPVVQLSIDRTKPPAFHHELGKMLAPLRDEGVLIMGSGNLVHSLRAYDWDHPGNWSYDWAARFETKARELMLTGHDDALVDYEALGADAMMSIPTPDHYLPLLYVLGARRPADRVSFPVEGFDGGSMSMTVVQLS